MESPSTDRRPIVVLLVDDQPFIGAVVRRLLAAEPDIEVQVCLHAVEAVASANRCSPAVILQDLIMPDMDGLTVVGLLRSNPQTATTPIVVLSANDDAETRARAIAAGADGYLLKVPPKQELIACIRQHARVVPHG